MHSLKDLVERYGYGVSIESINPNILPFKVLGPIGKQFYEVETILGKKAHLPRYNKHLPNCYIIRELNDKTRIF